MSIVLDSEGIFNTTFDGGALHREREERDERVKREGEGRKRVSESLCMHQHIYYTCPLLNRFRVCEC